MDEYKELHEQTERWARAFTRLFAKLEQAQAKIAFLESQLAEQHPCPLESDTIESEE
jgi:hypothetical protein